jgi:hypothetical protein
MPSSKAAPVVQRLCGAEKPLPERKFPEVSTSIIGCDASQAELQGQRVDIDAQFYKGKLIVVSLKPPADAPKEWWGELEKSLDAQYGQGTNDTSRPGTTAREWKTKGVWIRTNNYQSVAFASHEAVTERAAVAAKVKATKDKAE